jgi:hypothetical protein
MNESATAVSHTTGRFFSGVRTDETDLADGYLRATYYFGGASGHLRVTIWDGSSVRCALSLPAAEAQRLADWLSETLAQDR